MTKEQFNNLKVGDKVKHQKLIYTITEFDFCEQLMFIETIGFKRWVRFENCSLVEQDRLVEYLHEMIGLRTSAEAYAQQIRKICREEFVENLKFPSYLQYEESVRSMVGLNLESRLKWFIEQVKTLNK